MRSIAWESTRRTSAPAVLRASRRQLIEVGREPIEREFDQAGLRRFALNLVRAVEQGQEPLNRSRHVAIAQLAGGSRSHLGIVVFQQADCQLVGLRAAEFDQGMARRSGGRSPCRA